MTFTSRATQAMERVGGRDPREVALHPPVADAVPCAHAPGLRLQSGVGQAEPQRLLARGGGERGVRSAQKLFVCFRVVFGMPLEPPTPPKALQKPRTIFTNHQHQLFGNCRPYLHVFGKAFPVCWYSIFCGDSAAHDPSLQCRCLQSQARSVCNH